ncbi:MAG TPA: hypothetical protein VGR90_06570, partial [Acidimicrobiales bacterium]|nr:hypothetical protein [Acidimicrobiales bacterium]
GATFSVAAAQVDITPPALDTSQGQALDTAEFVPVCGTTESQVETLWPGKRPFAFEEPYVDVTGAGQYVPGDPYCDADGTHRYEAPYIAGGSGENRWPLTSADAATNSAATRLANAAAADDPIGAQAVVFDVGGRKAAMVTVDSIGIFDSTMDQIRASVATRDKDLSATGIFISSTHDESAPDPIGLWGPDLSRAPGPINQANGELPSGISSGVDEYYMSFLVSQVASAIEDADAHLQAATLHVATARMPADTQSCWSSYPFVDTDLVPVLQGVATSNHRVLFTLVNVGTHDETLAFSGNSAYTSMLSGDWTGRLAQLLAADYPGSIGMEMAGLVGSVETPAIYPAGTQVAKVPGALHDVPGSPVDGCRSVYPEPAAVPYSDALTAVNAYSQSVADMAETALQHADTVVPASLEAQKTSVCVQLENNFFAAAFGAGLFPDRPAYADPACTVGASASGSVAAGGGTAASVAPGAPAFIDSAVGVLSLGPVQIAYSPGEVFPFTEVGGPVDEAQMPFPTSCYQPSATDPTNPAAGDYTCGAPLPMTPDVSASMTGSYRFLAGLGQDMIGYLFPPGNFIGSQGETVETPWSTYEETSSSGNDRFGYGHSDDAESVGPHAGLAVTDALTALLGADGRPTTVVPGLFVDTGGHLCDSPFPASAPEDTGRAAGSWVTGCAGFTGAVGVRVVENGAVRDVDVGGPPGRAVDWATYLATPDGGTAGTPYAYSTATRGVIVNGSPLLIDVFSGAAALGRS